MCVRARAPSRLLVTTSYRYQQPATVPSAAPPQAERTATTHPSIIARTKTTRRRGFDARGGGGGMMFSRASDVRVRARRPTDCERDNRIPISFAPHHTYPAGRSTTTAVRRRAPFYRECACVVCVRACLCVWCALTRFGVSVPFHLNFSSVRIRECRVFEFPRFLVQTISSSHCSRFGPPAWQSGNG